MYILPTCNVNTPHDREPWYVAQKTNTRRCREKFKIRVVLLQDYTVRYNRLDSVENGKLF